MSDCDLPEWVKFVNSIAEREELSLYDLALERIKSLERKKGEVIRFPAVFGKLCPSFQIKKDDAWSVLHVLESKGRIEIVPFQGVRIKIR